jgi:NlpC/P60 family putative phage cell wall peptidase
MMDQVLNGHNADAGDRVVRLARSWIGTPYLHQASCRGAGADCLGLVRGIWRELHGDEPEAIPPYTPDWSETDRVERLLHAAARHLVVVSLDAAKTGDVLVLRMVDGSVAKHMGILAQDAGGQPTLIHAYSGHGVVESPFTGTWRRRVAAAFRFGELA